MANSWGENSWGLGEFSQQNNNTVYLTSVVDAPLTWNAGNFGSNFWGGQFPYVGLSLGDETSAGQINDGWGRGTWSSGRWGLTGDVLLQGQQLNLSLDSVSITAEVNDGWGAYGWGVTSWDSNTLDVVAFPTGQQLNISLNNVSINFEVNTGWGRKTWGIESWGGDGIWEYVSVNGEQLNISQGDETAKSDVIVDVFSTINAGWGQVAWGTQEWGQGELTINLNIAEGEVDPSPDATVTGIGMTIDLAIGTVVIGTGNVTLIGEQINISQGTAIGDANTLASVTGIGLNTAVGTVFAGTTSVIPVTGNGLTITLNSINNQIWTEINTGTDATWIEIDTAA
jgi:hypothetical protein